MFRSGETTLIVILLLPTIWALVGILRAPREAWADSRQSQGLWMLMVLVMPILGPALYFLVAKPRIDESS